MNVETAAAFAVGSGPRLNFKLRFDSADPLPSRAVAPQFIYVMSRGLSAK